MIYTTIISFVTMLFTVSGTLPEASFISKFALGFYMLPLALAGGTVAYLIKVSFIDNMLFFGTVGNIIWRTIFWSFGAQIIGAIGAMLFLGGFYDSTGFKGFLIKAAIWIGTFCVYGIGIAAYGSSAEVVDA